MTLQQLMSPVRRAIDEFNMIDDGDHVAVGLSGGKDSVALTFALAGLMRFYPKKFSLSAITVDLGLKYDEAEKTALDAALSELGVPHYTVGTDIYEIVFNARKESNPCSLCSKMRRGALAGEAMRIGANKIALGHNADDLAETLLLSLFFEGRFSTLEPKTLLTRSKTTVIRPLIFVEEKNIRAFSKDKPIVHNPCPADKHTNRQLVKEIIGYIQNKIPISKERMLTAIYHPERNHLFDEAAEKFVHESQKTFPATDSTDKKE